MDNYESLISELETINEKLKNNDNQLKLTEAVTLFEKGKKIVEKIKKILVDIENQVKQFKEHENDDKVAGL